ncbi:MAG: glycosyl-4,4'-diaponeurosporenoate acyltransferase [Candidatus Paraimprobicoccus trichonymphae]|uniref:Glycosyl-4,4'-diaponeurosporenoate acyltransferase n=1 Tax=Candidatus Paraimprobicoccus trichonymphae TaxID=3033793 RepID=A0AA48HZ60_9FIRM|nr:MAG: glycosyl-4,4'-diaponeurosporenoate acyltransferase [Candidatus Paraimprobicoccus trichonymphae]
MNLLDTYSFCLNFLVLVVLNSISLIFVKTVNNNFFDNSKKIYTVFKWEQRFYSRFLKINFWKDKLPQHIGKNGFSKKNIASLNKNYLKAFVVETCRAEWFHLFFIISSFFCLFFNKVFWPVVLCMFVNLPFVFIQRYNRIRISKLIIRKTKIKT